MFPSLTLTSLHISTPDGTSLLRDFSHAFGAGRHGIVGRNGCGKSSLLRVMAGLQAPASGLVHANGSLALLDQDWPDVSLTLADALGVADGLACIARLCAGDGSVDDAAEADWTLEERIASALSASDLSPDLDLDRRLESLSGGERMRLALAKIRLDAPDILLLDEPGNNMDAQGRALIARLIADWPGCVILASHDREMLEPMDQIIEISGTGITIFGGGWSTYAEARDARLQAAADKADRLAREVRKTELAVQKSREKQEKRNAKGKAERSKGEPKMFLNYQQNRAEGSTGRLANLGHKLAEEARAEHAEAAKEVERLTPLTITLPATGLPAGREVLRITDLHFAHGDRVIFESLNLALTGPERLAIEGPNGSGKSTLLKLITGELTPQAGTIHANHARLAILDQHVTLLDPALSVLENMEAQNPDLTHQQARDSLARFAFRADAALKPVHVLSGGEKMRAGLAAILSRPQIPELLLLDEPTNHLDADSTAILETALKSWDGALIMVSHDRHFISNTGVSRTITLPFNQQYAI